VASSDDLLGAMWAVIATLFVYRDTQTDSRTAAISRLAATVVSLVLCLVYLLIAPSHPWAMAMLIALGSILVTLAGRSGDAVTTGVTIAVVMVVAEIEPRNAWEQPILRFADTVLGVIVGLATAWLVHRATHRDDDADRPGNSSIAVGGPDISRPSQPRSLGDPTA
jgi:uncharacterized membrane protein YccC